MARRGTADRERRAIITLLYYNRRYVKRVRNVANHARISSFYASADEAQIFSGRASLRAN